MNPTEQCIICGNKPNTKEDIVPQWLQAHFDLRHQIKLGLWNNTAISYGQALIQLCRNCNNNKLSRLENRIKDGKATDIDYYLWALKIRFLLSVKDTTLQLDRRDKTKGKLLSLEEGFAGHEFITFVLQNFEDPNFCMKPNPFGSVFLLDNPIKDSSFGFVDVPSPYWGLSISLPNSKILAILFTDRGMVKREIEKRYENNRGIQDWLGKLPVESTNKLIKVLMLKLLITQYQIGNIPYEYHIDSKEIISDLT